MGSEFHRIVAQVNQLESALGWPKNESHESVSVHKFFDQLDAKLTNKLKDNMTARRLLFIREKARERLLNEPGRDPVMSRTKLDFVLNSVKTIKELESLYEKYDMVKSSVSHLVINELRELGMMTSGIVEEISSITNDLRKMLAAASVDAVTATGTTGQGGSSSL